MRKNFENQLWLDSPPIEAVELNTQCRDEIIPILKSLQHIYKEPELCSKILHLVAQDVNKKSNPKLGRPGFYYWQIFVLASVRLGCNYDYDKLQDIAENHRNLRQIMGVSDLAKIESFDWGRIRDNVALLRPETLEKINHFIVTEGHRFVPKAVEAVRVDSFVTKTNIHYPTEASLIGDGLRKILTFGAKCAETYKVPGWRQNKHLLKKLKSILYKISTTGKGQNSKQRFKKAFKKLCQFADRVILKAVGTRDFVFSKNFCRSEKINKLGSKITFFANAVEYVCEYACRRIFLGEKISNSEKLFSIFEPHTQLINRGKKPNPIEFGHRVLVVEDTAGFICRYEVMDIDEIDQDIAVPTIEKLQNRFQGRIRSASFDRGFHKPENQIELRKILEHPCLPVKGYRKAEIQKREATIKFRKARKKHPGVESAIGALQRGNGLGRCRDKTYLGFKRYIALGILGRNLHVLGKILIARENPNDNARLSKRA